MVNPLHLINICIGFFLYIIMFLMLAVPFLLIYLLTIFSVTLKKNLVSNIKRLWVQITFYFFSFVFPNNINMAYDKKIFDKKKVIIICNHISNFDWIIVMRILYEFDLYDDCYFIMKESLSKIFFIGFCMKIFGFIFLKRNWAEDKKILKKQVGLIKQNDFSIVIFPEGTFLDEGSRERMQTFIKTKSVNFNPTYTLYPKVNGFNTIYDMTADILDSIIDITIVAKPFHPNPGTEYTLNTVLFEKQYKMKWSILINVYKAAGPGFIIDRFREKNLFIAQFSLTTHAALDVFKKEIEAQTQKEYSFKSMRMLPDRLRLVFIILVFLIMVCCISII
ncbi:Lysocardiolipin acyltransferase 1 [Cucumispora dikerogammari]|nr:Lysocardiolipin acyltransferase 1 [Cucumispora dikerogammari]